MTEEANTDKARIAALEKNTNELFAACMELQAKLDISLQSEGAIRQAWINDKMTLAQRFKTLQENLQAVSAENAALKNALEQTKAELAERNSDFDELNRSLDNSIDLNVELEKKVSALERRLEQKKTPAADDDIPF